MTDTPTRRPKQSLRDILAFLERSPHYFWPVIFVALSVVLNHYSAKGNIDQEYRASLVSANITIGVFAVNFSFLAYQFAPYRALCRSISNVQIGAAAVLLLVAMSPLIVMSNIVYSSSSVPQIALTCIPLVAGGGIALLNLAARQADPIHLLERKCSQRSFSRIAEQAADELRAQIDSVKSMELSKITDRPTHEHREAALVVAGVEDPFEFAVSLGLLSIANADSAIFRKVVSRLLTGLELLPTVSCFSWKRTDLTLC